MNAIVVNNSELIMKVLTYIDDSEVNSVIEAIGDLDKYEQFDLSWKICLSNSIELSDICSELRKGLDENISVSESNITNIKYNLSKLIVNFLSSYFNFVTFCEIYSKKWFGNDGYSEVKKITSKFYDDGFVYQLYYKFRNYITHCGLPINTAHLNNKEGLKTLHFIILKEKILSYDSWGIKIKKVFQDSSDCIDIAGLFWGCHTMVSCLAKEIHDYIIQKITKSLNLMSLKLGSTFNIEDSYKFYIFDLDIPLEDFDWKLPINFSMFPISTIALNPLNNYD